MTTDTKYNLPKGQKDITKQLPRHPTKRYKPRKRSSIKRIIVHTTDMIIDPWSLAEFDIKPNHISDTGCPGITYHEMIMPDGFVYKTLYYKEVSWHVGAWNRGSLGLALSYECTDNKGKDRYAPTEEALAALKYRCAMLCLHFKLHPDMVIGHRELKGTGWFWFKGSKRLRKTCPGLQVDLDKLRQSVAIIMQTKLEKLGYLQKVDGIFGPKSINALRRFKINER